MLTTTHHMALVPRVTPDVHGSVLEGEMVLLNLTSGRYYTLNTVGAVVWGLCTGTSTLREIGEVICGQFEVSFELACEDIYTLVVELEAEGLVSIEGGDASGESGEEKIREAGTREARAAPEYHGDCEFSTGRTRGCVSCSRDHGYGVGRAVSGRLPAVGSFR